MSLSPLRPVITQAGLAAVLAADNTGLSARITHIALGDVASAPTGGETALRGERLRVPVASGSRVADTTLHLTALVDPGPEFWIREFGVILDDGTLFAMWSSTTVPLAYRTNLVALALAFDLTIDQVPPSAITVEAGDVDFTLFFGDEFAASALAHLNSMTDRTAMLRRLADAEREITRLSGAVDTLSARFRLLS